MIKTTGITQFLQPDALELFRAAAYVTGDGKTAWLLASFRFSNSARFFGFRGRRESLYPRGLIQPQTF